MLHSLIVIPFYFLGALTLMIGSAITTAVANKGVAQINEAQATPEATRAAR